PSCNRSHGVPLTTTFSLMLSVIVPERLSDRVTATPSTFGEMVSLVDGGCVTGGCVTGGCVTGGVVGVVVSIFSVPAGLVGALARLSALPARSFTAARL